MHFILIFKIFLNLFCGGYFILYTVLLKKYYALFIYVLCIIKKKRKKIK